MIPKWKDRPIILANLLNPAFCGEVLRIAIKSYKKESNNNMPFALIFIILPLILHKNTRDNLPQKISSKFYEWLENNVQIRFGLPDRIKNMVPYTRETISFLIYYEAIEFDNYGDLSVCRYRKKTIEYPIKEEIEDIFSKADMLGKWLTKFGSPATIYAILGIKP